MNKLFVDSKSDVTFKNAFSLVNVYAAKWRLMALLSNDCTGGTRTDEAEKKECEC